MTGKDLHTRFTHLADAVIWAADASSLATQSLTQAVTELKSGVLTLAAVQQQQQQLLQTLTAGYEQQQKVLDCLLRNEQGRDGSP